MELHYREIAANFNVALGTVYNINFLFADTGDVIPKKVPRQEELRSLGHTDELLLLGLIVDCPS